VSRLILALAALLLLVGGCASSPAVQASASHQSGQTVTVAARSLHGAGTVLVNSRGYALYMFEPDGHRMVTCTGACAGTWPPLKVPSEARLAAGRGVNASLLGSDPDPAGGRVVTYGGWPLYTYSGDVQPGQVTGQAIDLNGGEWYLIRPSGQPLIPSPQS
jgi:predicted lipoprotein with Yx(FWY)xxD motif